MKIALVRPNYKSHLITPPLGLGYLSSYLKTKGYQVEIIDGLNLNLTNQQIVQRCQAADLVGLSILSDYYLEAKDLCQKLKRAGQKVVLGGPHPTALPQETLEETGADYVVVGEGEETLYELVQALDEGREIESIAGLLSASKICLGPWTSPAPFRKRCGTYARRPLIPDLDSLPWPDWSSLDPRTYQKAPHGGLIKNFPVAPVVSTRGCPYACKFCASPHLWGRNIRFRSPAGVVDEIEYLVKNFQVKEIHFEDDNLTLQKNHVAEICHLILARNLKISWATPNGIRADKVDLELLQLMKRAGCYYIVFGIESGHQEILDNIQKKETLADIERAVKLAKQVGLMTQGFFIFGLPGETKATIQKTINFAKRIPLDRAQFLLLDLLPGSALWQEHKDEIERDYSSRSYQEVSWVPPTIDRATLEKMQPYAFRSFFFRPRPLFSLLRHFKFSQIKFIFNRLKDFRIIN